MWSRVPLRAIALPIELHRPKSATGLEPVTHGLTVNRRPIGPSSLSSCFPAAGEAWIVSPGLHREPSRSTPLPARSTYHAEVLACKWGAILDPATAGAQPGCQVPGAARTQDPLPGPDHLGRPGHAPDRPGLPLAPGVLGELGPPDALGVRAGGHRCPARPSRRGARGGSAIPGVPGSGSGGHDPVLPQVLDLVLPVDVDCGPRDGGP